MKKWLNEIDIVWYESKGNLNWTEILKTIREDLEDFIHDGGFHIFLGDTGENEGEDAEKVTNSSDSDENDEDYEEDDDGSTDSDSEESVVNDDDEGGAQDDDEEEATDSDLESVDEEVGTSDEEEEKGLTWEELEQKAVQEDRKRARKAMEVTTLNKKSRIKS